MSLRNSASVIALSRQPGAGPRVSWLVDPYGIINNTGDLMLKKLLVVLVASAFTAGAYAQPKPAEPAKSTEAAKPADKKAAKAEKKAKKQAKKEAKVKKDVK
jgi:hypothetical protein